MTEPFARLDAFLAETRRGASGRLRRLPAHPLHQHALRASGRTWSPRRRSWPSAWSAGAWSTSRCRPRTGIPIVYADWLHAEGAPTVLVYGHYDVQPVDPLDLWVRPPFEPRVEDGRIYARGAADDKGQVHIHLWAARAWLETQGRLPINVRYVFEGEEESGSTHFDGWLEANRHRLACGRRGHQRHRLLRGQPAGHHGRAAGPDVRPDRRHGTRRRPALGYLGRQRAEPRDRPVADHRCAQARGRQRRRARLL